MLLSTNITCPYCGATQSFQSDEAEGREMSRCQACQSYFVVTYQAVLTTRVRSFGENTMGGGGVGLSD